MQIVQIVSRLPPAIDGVGDYAFLLAKQLRAAHGIHTEFVVCDPTWKNNSPRPSPQSGEGALPSTLNSQPATTLDGFPIHQLKEKSAAELLRVLAQPGTPSTVLLQYVGYGYQGRGCPVWLVRALREWKSGKQIAENTNQRPEVKGEQSESGDQNDISAFQLSAFSFQPPRRLLTMFHEISASGPVWSSAFWTAPVQRWVAKSLARLSDHCFTNLKLHARALQKFTLSNESAITVLPVFSNVGEPEQLPAWNLRAPRMIVFGSAGWRRKVYSEYKTDLEEACRAMGLKEIVDIGAPVEIPQLSVRVSEREILRTAEVSREMLNARAGFFTYPVNCLGKSGIFAAYAAHGLVPVTFNENSIDNLDGLVPGEHFVSVNATQNRDADHLQNIGESAHKWYLPHSVKAQVSDYIQSLHYES